MIRNVSNSQPVILIENKQIKQVNISKTLGTTIDHHLTWKPNTENICKKQHQESQLYVVLNRLLLKETHLFPYTMPWYIPTLTTVPKYGIHLAKYNPSVYKSSKTELLELFLI